MSAQPLRAQPQMSPLPDGVPPDAAWLRIFPGDLSPRRVCLTPADLPDDLRQKPGASQAACRVASICLLSRVAGGRAALNRDEMLQLSPPVRDHLVRAMAGFICTSMRINRHFLDASKAVRKRLAAEEERRHKLEMERLASIRSQLYIGSRDVPEHWATFGWRKRDGRRLALARSGGQLIIAVGNLGSGKSQTSTALCEALLEPLPPITSDEVLPTAPVSFTYVPDGLRLPDILTGLRENGNEEDADYLRQHFLINPRGISNMRLVMPEWLIQSYQEALKPFQDQGLQVVPLRFRLSQMAISGLEMLVGGDRTSSYVQLMMEVAEHLGEGLRIDDWKEVIKNSKEMDNGQKRRALGRMQLLSKVASDEHDLWDMLRPGEYTVFALGGKWIRDSEAMPLIMALMNALSQPSERWGLFQRFFLMDEFNRYDIDPVVKLHLLTVARQIRHRGASLMLCGQDLRALHDELVALATAMLVFRLESRAVWNDIKERRGGFSGISFEDVRAQVAGKALLVACESTDDSLEKQAQHVYIRPTLCQHGGFTKSVG